MKGISLKEYNPNLIRAMFDMNVSEKIIARPHSDQVLIKTDASPVNPSDIAFIRGMYNIKKELPVVPGFEGTGTVIETGDHPSARALSGKRVSAFCQGNGDGTWADHFIACSSDCFLLKNEMEISQAACLIVNPFTAYGIYNICRQKEARAIVQNASSGQVGRMIRFFAASDDIPVINIVRKEKHIKDITDEGEEYVLNSSSDDFIENFRKITQSLNANIAVDAVGGDYTGQLMNALPDHSEIIVYGGLSGSSIGSIDPLEIIFKSKKISGFNLNDWMKTHRREELDEISMYIQDLIISGKLNTRIKNHFSINDIKSALKEYISDMSGGKVLFSFN